MQDNDNADPLDDPEKLLVEAVEGLTDSLKKQAEIIEAVLPNPPVDETGEAEPQS